ncbi:site-specific DNA-methyltransferase [Massiliimalia massiliensis]|uniref:site-specific DNA-methyltransferase n=1 Tax=Massiliimalia massiliensis TaxID=1852384 RepID=UPI0009851C26|nr:site-specific DNA-methyltransferase [Massiliimalia massiliensis]
MANERLDRFTKLLKEIFELDKSDLDFGIYRVMNLRKTQIETFLTERLPQMVQETLAPFAQGRKEEIRTQMTQIEENVAGMDMTIDALSETAPMKQKYIALQKQLAEGADLAALETDVYSALYSFFNRYYEEGDFISKRRYKEGVYAIPYEGEEVKLYWANQDQYYIKTSENFKDYTFVFDGISVHFRLVDATTEQNNNKEGKDNKRVFMLFTEDEENYPGIKTFEYDAEAREIVIRFIYDIPEDKKRKYAEENYDAIQKWLLSLRDAELIGLLSPLPTGKGKETTTLLEKHLKGYVAKNTFDYFIHKDLRGFLTRELDFFIKSEVMHLEDLDTGSEARVETYLAKIKTIKRIGKIIIDFLAQIEDFQKKLWLKKKFVVETNWCITLDKIAEAFWSEIIANKAQIDEWISMYAIDEAEGWSNPPTVEFLRQNKNLIIDTKHFSSTFKYTLLESIPDLSEQTSGLMVQGDNIQALALLDTTFRGRIKCIHIDPPYNTDTSGFLYKNNYRHSSWMSMMDNRINAAIPFLSHEASFICHIDENEYENLWYLFQNKSLINLGTVVWDKKNPMTGGHGIATQHEYLTWFSPDDITISINPESAKAMLKKAEELIKANKGVVDDHVRAEYRSWLSANAEIERGDKAYSNISDDGRIYQSVSLRAPEYRADEKFHRPLIHPVTKKPCPVPYNGFSRKPETLQKMIDKGDIIFGDDETVQPRYKMYLSTATKKQLNSVIYESKKGTTDLKKMGLSFPYCHAVSFYDTILSKAAKEPDDIVLDFFAGSGTTGHAVISDNRNNENAKKYILIEMGEYFEIVTRPRIKKVVYAPEWKDGLPKQRDKGITQIIKYIRLESYEDALSNIELSDDGGQLAALLGEDYLIHYMVDLESRGSLLDVEAFSNPFAYTMKITEKNECKEHGIDLCETFNYLIGLTVNWQSAISYYLSKPAETPAYEGAVDLVSDISGQYAFRQIEGTLPDGRRALVIWRTVTEDIIASNAALDAYFTTYRKNAQDRKYDVIFVNGDNNLENLRGAGDGWKVQVTEIEFKKRMFEEV